ncbi:MAG TPA: polysaccharide deacetylase family protein [Magnetospirillum sp.]|nr:polysaccharide deacetylase family protein [Magnetospirillum sp.]
MRALFSFLAVLLLSLPSQAEVVGQFPAHGKVVALTFDACEARGGPATFDRPLLDYLEREKLPFTIFATGLFAQRNRDELVRLADSPLVEVENHSFDHPQHMERLDAARVTAEVEQTDRVIGDITGRKPVFFRFPAGNYDAATLATVEATGHRVVHWRWPSGDPAKGLQPQQLRDWVLAQVRPGDVLIFHINGRAPATHVALPEVVAELRRRGYGFVRLDEALQ